MSCTVSDCARPLYVRGICLAHYHRLRRYGSVHGRPVVATPQERFWPKVDRTETCWLWTGSATPLGYGHFSIDGRKRYAHRVSFEWANGPIPSGLDVDHICHEPPCVNPSHLRLATRSQNNQNHSGVTVRNRSTGVRGVHIHNGSVIGSVRVDDRVVFRKSFPSVEEAERAVLAQRLIHHTHNDRDRA